MLEKFLRKQKGADYIQSILSCDSTRFLYKRLNVLYPLGTAVERLKEKRELVIYDFF